MHGQLEQFSYANYLVHQEKVMFQQSTASARRLFVRRVSGYCAVLAALLLTLVAPQAYAQAACKVVYTISPQSTSAFGAAITIQNTGTTAWTGWTLTWAFANGQTVSQLWNGIESQSGANVTVANEPYNGSVAAGGSVSGVGFNATWNGASNTVPASFAVNGVACGGAAGSFSLTPATATQTIAQGVSVTDAITVTDLNGFTGAVSLSAVSSNSGVTAKLSGNVLTIAASATATGTATITVTGTSGSLTKTTTVAVTVSTGSCTPTAIMPNIQINAGAWQNNVSTATVAAGSTVNLGPQPLTGTWSWSGPNGFTSAVRQINSIALSAGANVYVATYTNASNCKSTQTFSITETATGSFTLTPAAATQTIAQGVSVTDAITVTDVNGFTGAVTLSAVSSNSGVTAKLSGNVLTIAASATATGTATITVTGTSGALTKTTTVAVTLSSAGSFSLNPAAATETIAQGVSVTDAITVTDVNGFTGAVTLSAVSSNSGVTAKLSGNVLTIAASATATGTATITVTGTSGSLIKTTSIAITVTSQSGGLAQTFKGHFLDMYGDMTAANGYFSPLGIPYHSVETMIIEAPDYGHETVSETFSYYLWLETMYGAVTGTWTPLQTAWNSYQTYMIPSAAEQPTNAGYNPKSPATYAPTWDSTSGYPSTLTTSVPVGIDPLATELATTYGNPNIYGAHWIIDTSNWYGYGINESGTGTPSCINSYQRGPQESVWLTVPQPCWDNFVYGNLSDGGYLSLFTSGPYTQQWKYTDAPDADARAIQALYWAQQYSGGNSSVASLLPLAAELGDYLRYSFFDKYFKQQGCQSLSCPVENGTKNSSAYLLSWYYAWGGALPADGNWAWRIGSSDIHFGYQNPLAAYALSTDAALTPKSPTAKADWTTGLQRQIEFYRWLQSSNGAIAGGATNSWGGGSNANETAWGGQYAVPPAGTSTFYGLSYIAEPSYDNPPSNQWFGFQAWSMERVAEYYFVTGDAKAKIILDPWITWAEANTTTSGTSFAIPSSMTWSGQPALNWNAATQNWTPGTAFNAGLTVTITASSQDVGVTGSLCKTLLYYSAGTAKWAGAQDMPSFTLAQTLLKDIWADDRDSIGVSAPETGTTYNQINTPIFIPPGWTGTMPNGDPINSESTFLSIRTKYKSDPQYPVVAAYAAGTGPAPVFRFHRFWAETDVATAYAVYFLLFPND
jgi:Glycosyl hydrolase family 48/Cellulose binding domain